MIKNFILMCFCTVVIYSCSNGKKYEGKAFCDLLNDMKESDQKYRVLFTDPFSRVLDSIKKVEQISDYDYSNLSAEKQLDYAKKARFIANKKISQYTKVEYDSLMGLQIKLDNKNTELLIDIIETRGFPSIENSVCDQFPDLIFSHSQKEYYDVIGKLIEKEYERKTISVGTYESILKHINDGR